MSGKEKTKITPIRQIVCKFVFCPFLFPFLFSLSHFPVVVKVLRYVRDSVLEKQTKRKRKENMYMGHHVQLLFSFVE